MKEFYKVIRSSQLFNGISEGELSGMLTCLDAKIKSFSKDEFILRAGDTTEYIILILEGNVLLVQEDIWGNRNILSKPGPGQSIAGTFACAPGAVLNVSAVSQTQGKALFLNVKRILTVCSSACEHHNRVVRNLLGELAEKNLQFHEKLTHMSQRTTRAKILSYLSSEARRKGSYEFDVQFSRQQLADYLAVERSGLSNELGKMKAEGLIDFDRNHFILKQ